MKNFINYHILISHSPSCINRDDMNMQKTAVFGGAKRVRVSSQSLKRAIRNSEYYKTHLGSSSKRTRELGKLLNYYRQALKDQVSEQTLEKVVKLLAGKEEIIEETEAGAIAAWSLPEVKHLCEVLENETETDEKKLKKQLEKDPENLRKAFNETLDIALSGRMATSGLMTSIDGALAVAHAITTHAMDAEIDWFTAVDDLIEDEGDLGAGHLNTQEFSAGVFYRYASLNLNQLQENIGNEDIKRSLEIAAHVAHLLATVTPSGKQQSFAAHNLAECVLVTHSDMPISLANAFEAPIKAQKAGYCLPSIESLLTYWQTTHKAYGVEETPCLFLHPSVKVEDIPKEIKNKESLKALETCIHNFK